jgi:hypothetical protein
MATAVINNTNPNTNTNPSSNISISNVKTPSTTNTNASSSKRKIPNTLIIYLKTRIANYYKINFDPSMLVPKVNSHTVYIDPLVKYTKSAIRDLPNDAPKELLLTQFFLPNQFDSLINRILSSFFSMQSRRTLEEAKAEGIIDENIELTLATLFRRKNQFYINNRPYTIVGSNWNKGDWEIDTKPVEKLITPFAPLKGDELESAEKELNDLGAGVVRGNLAAKGIKSTNINAPSGPSSEKPQNIYPDTPEQMAEEEEKTQILSATDKKLLDDKLIPDALYILKDGLIKNDPIGYEAASNMLNPALPLTFIFLIDEKQITQFIEEQKTANPSGIDVYNNYIRTKTEVINETSVFFDLVMFEFGIKKKEFDTLLDTFNKNIIALKEPQPKIDINAVKKQIGEVNAKKREYMKSLFDLSKALLNIFDKQQLYFESLVALLTFTKTNYKQIIKYTRTQEPTLAYQCIDLDIQIYSSFTAKDIQNRNMLRKNGQPVPTANPDITVYADGYSKTIADYKQKHAEWFNSSFLSQYVSGQGTQINVDSEINKYKAEPCLIDVEHSQYTIYMFIIMLYAFINQSDIWRVYYGPISSFISKMQPDAQSKLDVTKAKINLYDQFIENPKNNAIGEEEVLGDIKKKQESNTKSNKKLQLTEQEQQYFDLTEAKIVSCEYITLYINSLELLCLRQNCLYISDENVNQIYIEIADSSDKYYDYIQRCFLPSTISATRTSITLPKAIMWGTDKINTKPTIEARIKSNDALKSLYISKKNAIKHSIDDLETYCEQIYKLISPVIDADGIKTQCADLLAKDPKMFLKMPQYVPRLQKWILNELKEYDEPTSNELNSQCKKIGSIYKRQGFKFTTSYQDWVALKNDADLSELDKEHYNDIYSIIKKLNGQSAATATVTATATSFNPVLIVFELANPQGNIKKDDYVLKKGKGSDDIYRVENDILPGSSEADIVNITATTGTTEKVQISELEKYLSISVDCSKMQSPSAVENTQFLFFVKTQLDPNVVQGLIPSLDDIPSEPKTAKYELAFNHSKLDNKLVYNVKDIPEDIVMFLSQQCAGTNLNQAILKRAQALQVKPTGTPVIDQSKLLDDIEKYNVKLDVLKSRTNEIDTDISLANTCLKKISGDYYKEEYKGKSLYQYLVEGDQDVAQFLHTLQDDYNNFLREEEIKSGSQVEEEKLKDLIAEATNKIKEARRKRGGLKSTTQEYKDLTSEITEEGKKIADYENVLSYKYDGAIYTDTIAAIANYYSEPIGARPRGVNPKRTTINTNLAKMTKKPNRETIKKSLSTELTQADFAATIPIFRRDVEKYIEFLKGEKKTIAVEKQNLDKEIKPLLDQLDEEKKGVKEQEYRIQRLPEKQISEITNKLELDKEETKVQSILDNINKVLGKTNNPDLTEKYTKYKGEYEAKIAEIENRKKVIDADKKALIEKSKKERRKGYIEEEEEDDEAVKVGGGPGDEYYAHGNINAENQYNPYGPQPYGPQPYGQQMPYGQQPLPYGQQPLPYGPQPYGQPNYYNQAQLMNLNQYSHSNRALELTSKLAYYVSVELELYPGKSANTIQMAAVKCSSTFERIREAWADMMGYQYRPGTMSESYTYQNLDLSSKEKGQGQNERRQERGQNERQERGSRGGSVKHRKYKKGKKGKKRSVSCKIYKTN